MSSLKRHRKGKYHGIRIQINRRKSYLKRKTFHKARLERWKMGLSYIPGTKKKHPNQIASEKRVAVPNFFSLIHNTEETMHFFLRLKENLFKRKKTFINLEHVNEITNDAIVTMLSILSEFKSLKISISGNYPKNEQVKDIFIKSGFFDYISGVQAPKSLIGRNKILTENFKDVKSDITSKLVSDAVETVFGVPGRSPGIQRALIELMGNTFDHASLTSKKELWWLSVFHYIDEKKVCFAFVDNGLGILETIKQRPIGNLLTSLNIRTSKDILKEAMTGELGSRYQLKNRGQGLPSFLTSQNRKSFENLVVITNDAIGLISEENYLNLKRIFSGTLFYWEFNENNIWLT